MLAQADSPLRRTGARRALRFVTTSSRRAVRRSAALVGARLADDAGISLIEVVVASALVAIIAIGTLTGLEGASNATTDNRLHNQAAVLAAQSQETLRSEPTETLEALAKETEATPSKPYVATKTIENQRFTVEQKVEEVNGSTGVTGCTASSTEGETSHPGGYYFRVTSLVTWPQLGSRAPVKQASIITPRTGSVLEVTVDTAGATPEPVSGATVIAGGTTTTTGASGCVLFPFIKATTTSLTVEKLGYVTANGAAKFSASEIAVAPDITTQYQIILSPAGAIRATFTYNKEEVYKGVAVASDTIVASNPELTAGTTTAGTAGKYSSSVETPDSLSPFETKWVVYGGDCSANDIEALTKGAIKDPAVKVEGGKVAQVSVPLSHVELNVYEGTKSSHSRPTVTYPVLITDAQCAGIAATDEHPQSTTVPSASEASSPGHLEYPYQPFGRFALCLYNKAAEKKYVVSYENKSEAGSTPPTIYLGAGPANGYYRESKTVEGVTITTKEKSC